MANYPVIFAVLFGLGGILWQLFLRDALVHGLGVGREMQPVSDFPYKCHRISGDPNIQACEDMWLDQNSRTLYLACSESLARKAWMPK